MKPLLVRRGHCRSRIIATLGPATGSPAVLEDLVRAGVDVVRLNFSHGSHADHQRLTQNVRRVEKRLGGCVAVLQDLAGPKLRVARLATPELSLTQGQRVAVVEGKGAAPADTIVVEAAGAVAGLSKGSSIRIADGAIELRVRRPRPGGVDCVVVNGGIVRPRQGLNLPGTALGVQAFTRRDQRDLAFGLELGVDAVALSFVRDADDVRRVWRFCERRDRHPFIVAKIERADALENLDDILDVCSGVMVARGDLGVEIGEENVPAAQRTIVEKARARHRPVFTATQMLESMITSPTATRAEVSDVANAVREGADGLMLSGETAVGAHPVAAVETLVRVARAADAQSSTQGIVELSSLLAAGDPTEAVARAARLLARALDADAIVAFTNSGRTVRLVSAMRPRRPIFGVTFREDTWRRMRMMWGVAPLLIRQVSTASAMIAAAERQLVSAKVVRKGADLVVVCGESVVTGGTNTVKIHRCGQSATKSRGGRK